MRVVLLVLRGEFVPQVRLPHALVNVVATYDALEPPLVFHDAPHDS